MIKPFPYKIIYNSFYVVTMLGLAALFGDYILRVSHNWSGGYSDDPGKNIHDFFMKTCQIAGIVWAVLYAIIALEWIDRGSQKHSSLKKNGWLFGLGCAVLFSFSTVLLYFFTEVISFNLPSSFRFDQPTIGNGPLKAGVWLLYQAGVGLAIVFAITTILSVIAASWWGIKSIQLQRKKQPQ